MGNETCELLWLKILLMEQGFPRGSRMTGHCDNMTAIHVCFKSGVQGYKRTKHIKID